jgi:hypothetical protein
MAISKIIFLSVVFIAAFIGAWFIEPTLITADILSAICTIFSVLAGLILAIYALHISSIESAPAKSAQVANALVWDSKKSINRLSYFFWLYLIVLSFSLIVIVGNSIPSQSEFFTKLHIVSARATVFFSIFAMGISFFVPIELKYIQERKILESKEIK